MKTIIAGSSLLDQRLPDAEQAARRVAHIIGESSAAAQALRELDARRKAGEAVRIVNHRQTWIVITTSTP